MQSLPQFSLGDLAPTEFPEGKQIGAGILDLFSYSLSQRLKYPRVRLLAADGQVVVLRLAGKKSRHIGQILITDKRPYPGTYFGRIGLDGVLCPSRQMTEAVRELLERFAITPREEAFAYGQLTGRCCFCDALLSDARSLTHGYGPVCAIHWGLPWDADRKLHGMRDSLYFTLLAAKQEYESKASVERQQAARVLG